MFVKSEQVYISCRCQRDLWGNTLSKSSTSKTVIGHRPFARIFSPTCRTGVHADVSWAGSLSDARHTRRPCPSVGWNQWATVARVRLFAGLVVVTSFSPLPSPRWLRYPWPGAAKDDVPAAHRSINWDTVTAACWSVGRQVCKHCAGARVTGTRMSQSAARRSGTNRNLNASSAAADDKAMMTSRLRHHGKTATRRDATRRRVNEDERHHNARLDVERASCVDHVPLSSCSRPTDYLGD